MWSSVNCQGSRCALSRKKLFLAAGGLLTAAAALPAIGSPQASRPEPAPLTQGSLQGGSAAVPWTIDLILIYMLESLRTVLGEEPQAVILERPDRVAASDLVTEAQALIDEYEANGVDQNLTPSEAADMADLAANAIDSTQNGNNSLNTSQRQLLVGTLEDLKADLEALAE